MIDVDTLFLEELARRGIQAIRDSEGNYTVEQQGTTLSISLSNLRKDISRDADLGRIPIFVNTIFQAIHTPTWDEAKSFIRWQLEPIDSPLEDALHDQVSDQLALVLVLASPDETQIRWIAGHLAETWGQTKETLHTVAADNMAAIVAQATIRYETIHGHKLGMMSTDWHAFKAAMVFSRGFQPIVEPVLGWPVFVVMPCRDFVFIVPAADKPLLAQLGPVVVKEHQQGAYPLCTEVFELTGETLRAIFEYQKSPAGTAETPDDPAWRIVQYGGFLRFRVPVQWTDEPIERGTEYFDPNGAGRLMSLVLGKQFETPITLDDGRTEAESLAETNGGTVTPRDAGTWLVEFPERTVDDLTVWGWMLVAAVPPNQVQFASFKYYAPTAVRQAAPERVESELQLVRREVVTAFFKPVSIPSEPKPDKLKLKPATAPKPKHDKGDKN